MDAETPACAGAGKFSITNVALVHQMHYHPSHGHPDTRPNWKIAVYAREHGIAHFHIEGPDFRASVGIKSLEVIIGGAPSPILRAAREWALANQALLIATWQELNT